MIRPRFVILLSALGLLAGCAAESTERGATSAPATAEGTASPRAGVSSPTPALDPADVQGAWWSWAASAPSGRNPVEDTTGEHCASGQPRDRWFLAGTFGGTATRRCVVPPGRVLVAPLVNLFTPTKDDCKDFMASATGTLTIDGVARPSLRWSATRITFTAVADNPLTDGKGAFIAYGCGLWSASPPLAPGTHKVSLRGASADFRISVDYELTIAGS
jgi:hypothetical protein